MDINLNNEDLQKAIEQVTNAAVINCIGGWEVKRIIQEKASEVLLGVSVQQAIENAINNMEIGTLTQAITRELEKAIVKLATHTLKETMCMVVFEIRKGDKYYTSEEKKTEMAKIEAELSR